MLFYRVFGPFGLSVKSTNTRNSSGLRRRNTSKNRLFLPGAEIRDINGELLAANEPLNTVMVDGSVVAAGKVPPAEIASLLAGPLGSPAKMTRNRPPRANTCVLKKGLTEAETHRDPPAFLTITRPRRRNRFGGFSSESDTRRVYPNSQSLVPCPGVHGEKKTTFAGNVEETERVGVEGSGAFHGQMAERLTTASATSSATAPARRSSRIAARSGPRATAATSGSPSTCSCSIIVETELEGLTSNTGPNSPPPS